MYPAGPVVAGLTPLEARLTVLIGGAGLTPRPARAGGRGAPAGCPGAWVRPPAAPYAGAPRSAPPVRGGGCPRPPACPGPPRSAFTLGGGGRAPPPRLRAAGAFRLQPRGGEACLALPPARGRRVPPSTS